MNEKELIQLEDIQNKIYTIRGVQVMLDSDLAQLYGVEVRVLNQAVKRNLNRFPKEFMFQLKDDEHLFLRSQSVSLEDKRGRHRKYQPYAFTEQGVSMLSVVLRSDTAVKISIQIMNAFVAMRRFLLSNAQIFKRLDTLEIKQKYGHARLMIFLIFIIIIMSVNYSAAKEENREVDKETTKKEKTPKPQKNALSKKNGTSNQKSGGGKEISINLGGGVMLDMVKITGSGHDFYIGKYEVTQSQWERIMGNKPSGFKGANNPVENVSWNDICESNGFIEKINSLKPDGYSRFRLPTEVEWEYACRAGSATEYYWGNKIDGAYCWYDGNSQATTHPVGQKEPNAFGLYDMSGNVYEWCSDNYDFGSYYVVRGGGWSYDALYCRSDLRVRIDPSGRGVSYGFRVVFAPGR